MVIRKLKILKNLTHTAYMAGWLSIFAAILFPSTKSYSQFAPGYLIIQKEDQHVIPHTEVQFPLSQEEVYLPRVIASGNQDFNNIKAGHNSRLDSIYEYKNFGYYFELYRWYYQYTIQQQVDTVWRYFFNGNGEFENITEIRTYYTAGQLLKLVRRQPDFWAWAVLEDSTIIDAYTEEYEYENENLIHKIITKRNYSSESTSDSYYTYDEENRLIHSIIEEYGHQREREYFYNVNDELEYILLYGIYSDDKLHYSVTKYIYEGTDSIRQITRNESYSIDIRPVLDTISHWHMMDRFYETYDQQGRRISLMLIRDNIYEGEWIDYKVEFSWTNYNQLLHTSYYNWNGTMESGFWEGNMRIDNIYDEYGNLLFYEKTYYDARSHSWETDENKTYYYSAAPSKLTDNYTESQTLSIFPNPAQEVIAIGDSPDEISYFTIYSLYGFAVASGRLENQLITVSHLKPGIYIVTIRSGQSLYSGKFVKY